jgi:hypothetical protein
MARKRYRSRTYRDAPYTFVRGEWGIDHGLWWVAILDGENDDEGTIVGESKTLKGARKAAALDRTHRQKLASGEQAPQQCPVKVAVV